MCYLHSNWLSLLEVIELAPGVLTICWVKNILFLCFECRFFIVIVVSDYNANFHNSNDSFGMLW